MSYCRWRPELIQTCPDLAPVADRRTPNQHTSACVSIRSRHQHTSACTSGGSSNTKSLKLISQRTSAFLVTRSWSSSGVSICTFVPVSKYFCTSKASEHLPEVSQHGHHKRQRQHNNDNQNANVYALAAACMFQHMSTYVRYVSIRQDMQYIESHTTVCLFTGIRQHTSGIRQHTSAYVSIRQHTSLSATC